MSLVKGLKKKYDDFFVDIPRWEILDHGVTALSGPSGAGRSSVLRLLIGLDSCPTLSWEFQGQDLAKMDLREKRLGVVFQSLELFPHMSARENILFAARARRIPERDAQDDLESLVKELNLQACLDRQVSRISGGEKQRTALARALVGRPRILLLDEPFSSLDVTRRTEARALVKSVIERRNLPTILISHDPEDLKVLADRVDVIENGRLISPAKPSGASPRE
jgi:sulfate transport system ATP-binding protein/putative spermidine/putrescine transport system ATP-binding protein